MIRQPARLSGVPQRRRIRTTVGGAVLSQRLERRDLGERDARYDISAHATARRRCGSTVTSFAIVSVTILGISISWNQSTSARLNVRPGSSQPVAAAVEALLVAKIQVDPAGVDHEDVAFADLDPLILAAASRSSCVKVSPRSSDGLPRWRAMSISTARPTMPFSAMGRMLAWSCRRWSSGRRSHCRSGRRTTRGPARRTASSLADSTG